MVKTKAVIRRIIFGRTEKEKFLKEKKRILKYPRFSEGYINLLGRKFIFNDNRSFLNTYNEIFENRIYEFHPDEEKKLILDCGANMGISVLYFSLNYPNHRIIAFEPDPYLFNILEKNVQTFELKNVELIQKAVWDKEDTLKFYTDGGLGGRVKESYRNQIPQEVTTVRLKDFITDNIDFLKIDIEGAETIVLNDCQNDLHKANNIFFEYHGYIDRPQNLHELLSFLQKNCFHYYIKESSTREKPYVDRWLICEAFDMAINIFAYKNR